MTQIDDKDDINSVAAWLAEIQAAQRNKSGTRPSSPPQIPPRSTRPDYVAPANEPQGKVVPPVSTTLQALTDEVQDTVKVAPPVSATLQALTDEVQDTVRRLHAVSARIGKKLQSVALVCLLSFGF
jgi:hypothetical protein